MKPILLLTVCCQMVMGCVFSSDGKYICDSSEVIPQEVLNTIKVPIERCQKGWVPALVSLENGSLFQCQKLMSAESDTLPDGVLSDKSISELPDNCILGHFANTENGDLYKCFPANRWQLQTPTIEQLYERIRALEKRIAELEKQTFAAWKFQLGQMSNTAEAK